MSTGARNDPTPGVLHGVGATAIGVAMIRARESERTDRLFDDPFACRYAELGREAFHRPSARQGSREAWRTVEALVDVFHETRVVMVRAFDDYVLDASSGGVLRSCCSAAGWIPDRSA